MRRLHIAALSVGVAVYAAVAYGFLPLGSLVHPQMKLAFESHEVGIYIHIFTSALALLLGPWQFSAGLRQCYPQGHRWSGRAYLVAGVLPGGLSGLYVAQFAFGGVVSVTGFSLLALMWLASAWLAYLAIRRGDVAAHQRWMLRNFGLTFAAVTLRIYLGSFAAAGVPFEVFYSWLSWLCWVPNLLAVEWLFIRKGMRHGAS